MIKATMVDSDIVVYWNDTTDPGKCTFKAAVNNGVRSIAKDIISHVFTEVFGSQLQIDPTHSTEVCVRKSNQNAMHDGVIEQCPVIPREGFVYQKLINNVLPNGMVEDIRIPVINNTIPLVYKKNRQLSNRFSNDNSSTKVHETTSVLSEKEIRNILHFCEKLQIDYCEIDAVRDYPEGLLYIVDVNHCPSGPPNHLAFGKSLYVIRKLARSFDVEYGNHTDQTNIS